MLWTFVIDVSPRYCDKAFAQSAHRLRHERMHTGEKPYACRYCSKRFGESAQVSRHERIHTGEKPFACEVSVSYALSRMMTFMLILIPDLPQEVLRSVIIKKPSSKSAPRCCCRCS